MRADEPPVVVEETIDARIETVWRSITEIDLMRQWYFGNIPDFKAEVGFETKFNIENEGRNFLHLWKVTEVIPMQKIVYDWKFDGYAGDSFVEFELFGQNDHTTLRVTCNVRESFPDDIPEFTRESCVGGWEYFIKKSLKEFLEKAST